MDVEELKTSFTAAFPGMAIDETGQWPTCTIEANQWTTVAIHLRHQLAYDYLFSITCVDWKTHLTMVYHLTSTTHRFTLVIKVNLNRQQPYISTVADVWRTAEFHEREVYDLFGVIFTNHPDLRRLFLTGEWKGWPLRKDYEDPINMIRL